MTLDVEAVTANPGLVTTHVQLPQGETVTWRLLRSGDGPLLGRYFQGLGEETRSRYGPHPLDADEARQLCEEIDLRRVWRFVAVADGEPPEIIAYFIVKLGVSAPEIGRYALHLYRLRNRTDVTLAPSVADAYQGQGVGSALMPHLLDVLRRLGKRRVVLMGGVQADNERALAFYRRFGFRQVGSFKTRHHNNYDMILELGE
jgi:GNAT superfamily N-acetyltransferase